MIICRFLAFRFRFSQPWPTISTHHPEFPRFSPSESAALGGDCLPKRWHFWPPKSSRFETTRFRKSAPWDHQIGWDPARLCGRDLTKGRPYLAERPRCQIRHEPVWRGFGSAKVSTTLGPRDFSSPKAVVERVTRDHGSAISRIRRVHLLYNFSDR